MKTVGNTPPKSVSTIFKELEEERKLNRVGSKMNNTLGTISVASTVIILAYGGIFGFISILTMYMLWLPHLYYKGFSLMRPTGDIVVTLLLPVLAVLSTLWSRYPSTTLYNSLEYASLVVCSIIAAKIVRTAPFIRGVVFGTTLVLLASLASGKYGVDAFSGSYTLIGLFGSKNMVGIFAEIGIVFSLLSLLIKQRVFTALVFSISPCLICMVTIVLSKSASSILSLAVTLAAMVAAYILTRLPRSFRFITFSGTGALFVVITAILLSINVQGMVLKSLGKNDTLTGRTHLWQVGEKVGMQTPILGQGYGAFWVPGQPKAEELWREFGVSARLGFHFHNLFVELFVELGIMGVLAAGIALLVNCLQSLGMVLRYGMILEYLMPLAVSVMFASRAYVEVDIIGTFSIGPFLFFSMLPRLATYKREYITPVAHTPFTLPGEKRPLP